jgi:phage terminase large subunit GpA-like protein
MVRPVFGALQNLTTRKVVVMVSAQAGKTQTLMIFAAWAVCEAPGPMFWVAASEEVCDEFTKARLLPLFEKIPDVAKRMPLLRAEKTLNLIQFATMPLYFRGANSPSKLKSTPVRWLVCDEVDDWKPGSLEKVMKRVRSYRQSKQVLISTPMDSGGDMHSQWLTGTQTFFHFACSACGHRQPFRFGREKSVIFAEAREQGGFLWDTNDTTRPGGKWNWAELRKSVRYQCEKCAAEFRQAEQFKLLQTLERVDRNPTPEPGVESFHWWAAYSLWVKWEDIVCEFVSAKEISESGNLEPLKSFVRETLGEPWHLIGDTADAEEILRLCGKYRRGEFWPVGTTDKRRVTRIIATDVQKDHLRYVLCQLREGGEMRVVDYGRLSAFDDLRALQEKCGVANRGVFLDSADGNRQTEILRECVRWNWIALRGSAQDSFAHKTSTGGIINRSFRTKTIDPFIGTAKANTKGVTRIEWSNGVFKDRLYLYVLKGKGPHFEIPEDVGAEFVAELQDERREPEKNARGGTVWKWKDSGNNHYGDCLLMALVAMDASAFSRGGALQPKPATEAKDYQLKA